MGWIAGAVSIGSSIIGAMGKADAAQQSAQQSQATDWGTQELKNTGQLENTQLADQEKYYYQQLDEAQKQRGLAQFAQFSRVNQFAPTYVRGANPIQVPNAPVIPQQVAPTGLPAKSSGSGLGGLLLGAGLGVAGGIAQNGGVSPNQTFPTGGYSMGGAYGTSINFGSYGGNG